MIRVSNAALAAVIAVFAILSIVLVASGQAVLWWVMVGIIAGPVLLDQFSELVRAKYVTLNQTQSRVYQGESHMLLNILASVACLLIAAATPAANAVLPFVSHNVTFYLQHLVPYEVTIALVYAITSLLAATSRQTHPAVYMFAHICSYIAWASITATFAVVMLGQWNGSVSLEKLNEVWLAVPLLVCLFVFSCADVLWFQRHKRAELRQEMQAARNATATRTTADAAVRSGETTRPAPAADDVPSDHEAVYIPSRTGLPAYTTPYRVRAIPEFEIQLPDGRVVPFVPNRRLLTRVIEHHQSELTATAASTAEVEAGASESHDVHAGPADPHPRPAEPGARSADHEADEAEAHAHGAKPAGA